MEAHGTGTGLGDPIEISAISAIVKRSGHKSCSVCAIKGNVGHTESTAGVANVIEVIGLLKLGEAALNVQLRTLNPQVRQVRAEVLHPSVDTNPMYRDLVQTGGASSFGWSGIIAHGVFQHQRSTEVCYDQQISGASLYRNSAHLTRRSNNLGDRVVPLPSWLAEMHGLPQPSLSLGEEVVLSGVLTASAEALFSHHVVGGTVLLPGVAYVETVFAASSCSALADVAFLRPCVLPELGRGEKCLLRCTRQGSGTL